jgi:hypothetical protein
MAAPGKRQPLWEPLRCLPDLAEVIDAQLAAAERHQRTLRDARHRPGSLDAATVERVISVYRDEVRFLDIYDEQLARWSRRRLTVAQRREIERLVVQVARNREVTGSILALADELRASTVDAILRRCELALGEILAGGVPFTGPVSRNRDGLVGYSC